MKDLVPKGTGNSRFLRSSIRENITHQELVALLRAGTFPVDFSGLNADGVAVVGSAYNKANVLPDDVCTALGVPTSAEPKDAFLATWNTISSFIDSVRNRIISGTYQGTDAIESGITQSITLGFRPLAVFVYNTGRSPDGDFKVGFCLDNMGLSDYEPKTEGWIPILSITSNGFKVINGNYYRFNDKYTQYAYFAIKEV